MKPSFRYIVALSAPLLSACSEPPDALQEDASARVSAALEAVEHARLALELLGLMPTYDCGASRQTWLGEAVDDAELELSCATFATESIDASADAVSITFPAAGCTVGAHTLFGNGRFTYAGGQDRMDVSADFLQLELDDIPLRSSAGYGTCGDASSYWAKSDGSLEDAGWSYELDAHVGLRDGIPVIGDDTLLLDGTGALTGAGGTDRLSFTGLAYVIGEYMPETGSLTLETASGHRIDATFSTTYWKLGEVQVTIDDYDPVTVPVVR